MISSSQLYSLRLSSERIRRRASGAKSDVSSPFVSVLDEAVGDEDDDVVDEVEEERALQWPLCWRYAYLDREGRDGNARIWLGEGIAGINGSNFDSGRRLRSKLVRARVRSICLCRWSGPS